VRRDNNNGLLALCEDVGTTNVASMGFRWEATARTSTHHLSSTAFSSHFSCSHVTDAELQSMRWSSASANIEKV